MMTKGSSFFCFSEYNRPGLSSFWLSA
jgi:hypothetical protein